MQKCWLLLLSSVFTLFWINNRFRFNKFCFHCCCNYITEHLMNTLASQSWSLIISEEKKRKLNCAYTFRINILKIQPYFHCMLSFPSKLLIYFSDSLCWFHWIEPLFHINININFNRGKQTNRRSCALAHFCASLLPTTLLEDKSTCEVIIMTKK